MFSNTKDIRNRLKYYIKEALIEEDYYCINLEIPQDIFIKDGKKCGKIYIIYTKIGGYMYVGSTEDKITNRLNGHVNSINSCSSRVIMANFVDAKYSKIRLLLSDPAVSFTPISPFAISIHGASCDCA